MLCYGSQMKGFSPPRGFYDNFISWLYICPRELRMWEIIKYMLRQVSRDKQNGQGGSEHLSKNDACSLIRRLKTFGYFLKILNG